MSAEPPGIGDTIADRYTLVKELGAGGVGIVFEAEDARLKRRVAIKVLRPAFAGSDEIVARFEREARASSALRSVHAARVFDVDRAPSGTPYIVGELLHGCDLQQELRARGTLPIVTAVDWMLQACAAVAEAHALGIVHRDLKPSNIFVVDEPGRRIVKVLDFGVSKMAGDPELSVAGTVLGSPGYMAPEQIRDSRAADERADVWSLGVILFRALSGRHPFGGDSAASAMASALSDAPPSLGTLRAEVPALLDSAVDRALAKDRTLRFQSVADFARAIAPFGSPDAGVRAEQAALPSARAPESETVLLASPPSFDARTNLVRDSSAFFGREADLERLDTIVAAGDRLLTLVGPGGTGKTRLARRFGELRGISAKDTRVRFCDLAGARTIDDVCGAVARVLRLSLGGSPTSDDAVCRIGERLRQHSRLLLILDNCEQIVDAIVRALAAWRDAAADTTFVVTSRERLRMTGERVYEVSPLPVPREGDEPMASDAVRLFIDRASHAGGEDLDLTVVSVLVQRLDGLPLAIELAAARAGVMSPAAMLGYLPSLDTLGAGPRDASMRQRTLRDTVDWSWSLLTPAERSAFAQLSVFRGGFTIGDAERVLDLSRFGERGPLDAVQSLRDKSLLRASQQDDADLRLGMLETLREYAAEKLEASHDDSPAYGRHRAHFAGLATSLAEGASGDSQADRRRRIARDAENLLAVHDRAMAALPRDPNAIDDALRVVRALGLLLFERGPWPKYMTLLDSVLGEPAADSGNAALHATVLSERGFLQHRLGRTEHAIADLEAALARAGADDGVAGRVLRRLATVERIEGRFDRARAHLALAVACARRTGDMPLLGRSLGALATVDHAAGDLESARRGFVEALAIEAELGDENLYAIHSSCYGMALLELGELDAAGARFEEAMRIHGELQDRVTAGWCVGALGWLAHERGDFLQARMRYEESIAIAVSVGDRLTKVAWLAPLGGALAALGDIEGAERALDEAEADARVLANQPFLDAIGAHRGQIDVARARRVADSGDPCAALRHRHAAEGRLRTALALASPSDDVRFARRLLQRTLGARAGLAAIASPNAVARTSLVIAAAGCWFAAPGSARVEVHGKSASLLLTTLAWQRIEAPGKALSIDALVAAGWPGERILEAAAANRVHVALASLRKLGLRGFLIHTSAGHLLDPAVPIVVAE